MADNFRSYSRFTALPGNIAPFGTTVEELQLTTGQPDRNPITNPVALPKLSRQRLFLRPKGSDGNRLEEPLGPEENAYEGPPSWMALNRSVLRKLSAPMQDALNNAIMQAPVNDLDQGLQQQMQASLQRLSAMREALLTLQDWTETIYLRHVSGNRG